MRLEKLKQKIKGKLKRKPKETMPVPKAWMPKQGDSTEATEKVPVVHVEVTKEPRFHRLTWRGVIHKFSTVLLAFNLLFGIMLFFSASDLLLKLMSAFFWLNGYMCLNVRKHTAQKRRWQQT